MTDINLEREYNSTGLSVQDLFVRGEEGFLVPLYQRAYTWEDSNIDQLFDDLILGIRDFTGVDTGTDMAATFLGTVILVQKTDLGDVVVPGEDRARPTAVQMVIDGQQRLSTLALLSILLIAKIKEIRTHLDGTQFDHLHTYADRVINRLESLHRIRLGDNGEYAHKPRLIHAECDKWAHQGGDKHYKSPIARYVAQYIHADAEFALGALDGIDGSERVRGNIKLIDKWLDDIMEAHVPDTNVSDRFPANGSIITKRMQVEVLGASNPVMNTLLESSGREKGSVVYFANAIYHLYVLAHYLLRRCGFNRLNPSHEDWGFDMFQSLNSTGVPLTVLETFLPSVMKAEQGSGDLWENTPSKEHMDRIQRLFDATDTNQGKVSRTNELFGAFGLCYNGEALGNKFSAHRKWLNELYGREISSVEEKRKFSQKLADMAGFFYDCWYMDDPTLQYCISGLDKHPEGRLASLLVQYLRVAKSQFSSAILARFYSDALASGDYDEFVEAVKACAAFFTLWRSSNSTQGLHRLYRNYFKGSGGELRVLAHNWQKHTASVSSTKLKGYFRAILEDKDIDKFEHWAGRANQLLVYSEVKAICRFCLFLFGHDRVEDPSNPGLTVEGTKGTCELLSLEHWEAKMYQSLDHVAPQKPADMLDWDPSIYQQGFADQIGNLVLLDKGMNSSVSNKSWDVRRAYYALVGERDIPTIERLTAKAKEEGINLNQKTLAGLRQLEYNCTLKPILQVGETGGKWDAGMIESRTRHIKKVVHKKLYEWLQ